MLSNRVKIRQLVENQIPSFLREDYREFVEFLTEYYKSVETIGAPLDILNNIDQYVKLSNITELVYFTDLSEDIDYTNTSIKVSSTSGFPNTYGLIQINQEVILYESKTDTEFVNCSRGFSGITSYRDVDKDSLIFSDTFSDNHQSGSIVYNLSSLFLKELFKKFKSQYAPGFDNVEFYEPINEKIVVSRLKDFYAAKGANTSFNVLFKALYGVDVDVIKPRDFVIQSSDADYRITRDLVVQAVEGDPTKLVNSTLFQDQTDYIIKASAPVTNVEKIFRDSKEYYQISLDYNPDIEVYKFTVHPKTKLVSSVNAGQTYLDVDSTISFPPSGNLNVVIDDITYTISYTSKSSTQFLGCTIDINIAAYTDIYTEDYAYGYDEDGEIIRVRVNGVLSELKYPENTYFYAEEDEVDIISLGRQGNRPVFNNWLFNITPTYEVVSLVQLTTKINGAARFRVETKDKNIFSIGDIATLTSNSGTQYDCLVISVGDLNVCDVNITSDIDLSASYLITRNVSKVNCLNQSNLNILSSDVQNVYIDNQDCYVVSESLPHYLSTPITLKDLSVSVTGFFDGYELDIGENAFYTGDPVYYKWGPGGDNLNIPEGLYFIKKVNASTIKLATSRSNIKNEVFVRIFGDIANNKFEIYDYHNKQINPQRLIRKLSNPVDDANLIKTLPGQIGILQNGVEILNYKSNDSVYYGPIERIVVSSPGDGDYDVINPPILHIQDPVGSGATAVCHVRGSLKKIDIIEKGYDYATEPKVTISGGNGEGAKAKCNLSAVSNVINFNAGSQYNQVNLTDDTIGFSTFHKLRQYEKVVYKSNDQLEVGGLVDNSVYYVRIINSNTVKLHKTYEESVSGINTVNLSTFGEGVHQIRSFDKKRVISSIEILDPGKNYTNKTLYFTPNDVNLYTNTLKIDSHGYKDKEIVIYNSSDNLISGLSSTSEYYVKVVDENNIRLSLVGTATTIPADYFYNTEQYISFTNVGTGIHQLSYLPITVKIESPIGVTTFAGQDFSAKIQPIFRGDIISTSVRLKGSNYGDNEIVNYNRQPQISLLRGSGALLTPIVSADGRIIEILVNNKGTGYNSIPTLKINGTGSGCVLTPIIENGQFQSVIIISSGSGYDPNNTSIEILPAGQNARFDCIIKSWNVNLVEKLFSTNQIAIDDGIISSPRNRENQLQYCHVYPPRKLREKLLSYTLGEDGLPKYRSEIENDNLSTKYHSPILGWAYDGNPIYGPYGYTDREGGSVKRLISGYKLSPSTDRPSGFPVGFFVEDYRYVGDGDLDIHNGRYCKTPEFPNGVYAYFATIEGEKQSVGPFRGFLKPAFPYFVGDFYKSKPIDFNFDQNSNQNSIDINQTNWFRNTYPYSLTKSNSYYYGVDQPNKFKEKNTVITGIAPGSVDILEVTSEGDNYSIGDKISFDSEGTGGYGASGQVALVGGKPVTQIDYVSYKLNNVEFIPLGGNGQYIGFASSPHQLLLNDEISVQNLNLLGTEFNNTFTVGFTTSKLNVTTNIPNSSITGIVTYFNVIGDLRYPNIVINDILGIGTEQVRVLEIDSAASRLKVRRAENSTIGNAHLAGETLTEITRKLFINVGYKTSREYKVNKEIYFNPRDSLAIGNVGIGTTITFSNPGVGVTQLFVPYNRIYLPNHQLNTGDEIVYRANGNTPIRVSSATSTYPLPENIKLYVAKYSEDLIGISSDRIGVGTTGGFVGIGSTTAFVYGLGGFGSGTDHSFITNFDDVIIGDVYKKSAIVTTSSPHGLSVGDKVNVSVKSGITSTFIVTYDDINRRLLINSKSFTASDVNLTDNSITLVGHGYNSGQKVLHTSTSPSGGLQNNKIYYVIVVDEDNIKLSNFYYKTINSINELDIVNITSASLGSFSLVNPEIKAVRNSIVKFDLSSNSLSALGKPAFDFNIYYDGSFNTPFYTTLKNANTDFNVKKIGTIGVSGNAALFLSIDENLPTQLYYNLVPINYEGASLSKLEIVTDNFNIPNNNKITLVNSGYTKKGTVVGLSSVTFTYPLSDTPEKVQYNTTEGEIEYNTESLSVTGPVKKLRLDSIGRSYKKLPFVNKVVSGVGTNALFLPNTKSIGRIVDYSIRDIGYNYPSDFTLRPTGSLPSTIKIEPLSKFESIKVISPGVNYYVAPELVVLDGFTGRLNEEVDLKFEIGSTEVKIIRNTTGLYNVTPKILPVNNPNGTRISSIVYNEGTSQVTVGLAVSYSSLSTFPFAVGEKVIIENTNIDLNEGGYGFNSADYEYTLFTLTAVNADIGGDSPTITYSLNNILPAGETPGIYDTFESFGTVTPEKYFPKFDIILAKDQFLDGEIIESTNGITGKVQSYDRRNEYLKIITNDEIAINDLIIGKTSGNRGIVSKVITFDSHYTIGSNTITRKGWRKTTGYLNDNTQRLHDNDYYQYFSYAVRSPISYDKWNPIVSKLNHTAGFKKFGELVLDSYDSSIVGIQTSQNEGISISVTDLKSEVDLNCVQDFDVGKEKSILVSNSLISNEIIFRLPFLQKYLEFIGNRVLNVDDVSSQFNNVNRRFPITSNRYPIFRIDLNGSDSNIVSVNDNLIRLQNHYFVSGEEIEYIPHNNDIANAIGIAATVIPGIGLTDKLPSTSYVIKLDNQKFQLAASPQNALLFNPIPLKITSVGIGTSHVFKSKNTNTRLLVSINNMIQSPIVSTAVTSRLVSSVGIGSTSFRLVGISSLFGGDLIKINNEIMKITSVGVAFTNEISVLRAWMGTSESLHTANNLVTKLSGNYNITDNFINFDEPIWGNLPVGFGTTASSLDEIDYSGITTSSRFNGRVFLRSSLNQAFTTSYVKAYDTNYVFDDISQNFNGITTQFTLKSNGSNIANISVGNGIFLINDIFQGPQRLGNPLTDIIGDYKLFESAGQTKIGFTGNPANFNSNKDINSASIPKGGIIVSVGSTNGLRYQPLVGAGGTAIVSVAGTIQSISIGNSGSGYRIGIQTFIKVGVQSYSSGISSITYVGYANAADGKITNVVITNPGAGFTNTNPPLVVIDEPLSYSDIPLIYSSSSPTGFGTGATVDIVVGQGSSVVNFELKNLGYGYGQGDILTVPIGGTTGIPTDSSTFTLYPYKEFQIYVDKTYNSKFSGWTVGDFLVLDNIEQFFNGRRRLFPLSRNGERLSFFAQRNSGIDIQSNLLVFVNDILQIPGEGYTFTGGSVIRFTEAPKGGVSGISSRGDKCKIYMYTGTQTIDVKEIDVLESVKIGDEVQLISDVDQTLIQEDRLVVDINAADSIITNNYGGQGVSSNELLERPVKWCRQTEDKIIDETEVSKNRIYYEPSIFPTSNILDNVGIGSTLLYVSSIRPFFDDPAESLDQSRRNTIEIISQENLVAASATCVVSSGGTVFSVPITNPGFGYTVAPTVQIQKPSINSNNVAIATAFINAVGVVTSIRVSAGGTGYFYGPLNSLSVIQQGKGFPSEMGPTTNIFENARLKTLSGNGKGATATLEINPLNSRVLSIQITNSGYDYRVGDELFVDVYDNVGLATTVRRYVLDDPIIFSVTSIKPPQVLIEPPSRKIEQVSNALYFGDYGVIVGVGTTNVGVTTGITFDLYIPENSLMRTNYAVTRSGIETGNYFVVTNSTVGFGITSLKNDNSVLGIGTTCLDNVYEVVSTSRLQRNIPTVGIATVVRVVTRVARYNGFVGLASTSFYYGEYSWGKIEMPIRTKPVQFTVNNGNRYSGISTNPIVRRAYPLKYFGYYSS